MNNYVIFADAGASLTPELCKQYDIQCVTMTYIVDKVEHTYNYAQEGAIQQCDAFYQTLKDAKEVSTSQVNQFQFEEIFAPLMAQGQNILYVAFSSGLSATCSQAQLAERTLNEEYPNAKIRVVDSLSGAAGQGVLAICASKNRAKGMTLEENAQWLESHATRCDHWFTVANLDALKRGGRVSPTVAFVGGLLNIRPMLFVDREGKLEVFAKARGESASWKNLIESTKGKIDTSEADFVLVDNAGVPENGAKLCQMLGEAIPGVEFITVPLSPVIGAHTGHGMLSVCHLGQER